MLKETHTEADVDPAIYPDDARILFHDRRHHLHFNQQSSRAIDMSASHKALILESKGTPFILGTRPTPKPGQGELLVRIVAAALNPVDRYMQDTGFLVPSYPIVCGGDAAGIVEEVGEGVQGFAKGDRV